MAQIKQTQLYPCKTSYLLEIGRLADQLPLHAFMFEHVFYSTR